LRKKEAVSEMKVISPKDCGNAPKKRVLNELIIAMAGRDFKGVEPVLAENTHWKIAGGRQLAGKDAVLDWIADCPKVAVLEILTIITHGRTAAANGRILTEEGVRHEFCHVFLFVSAGKNTLREVTTYVCPVQDGKPASS
jgi:hypothetical protein